MKKGSIPLLLFIFCLGCRSDQAENDARSWDACQILGLAEVEELMNSKAESSGNTVTGTIGQRPFVSQCHYHTLAGVTPYQSLGILVRLAMNSEERDGARDRYLESLKQLKTASVREALERIDDVGNGALYDAGRHQLIVFRGADMLILTGNLARKQDIKSEFVTLAQSLLKKLSSD